jgi:hypothetical protein
MFSLLTYGSLLAGSRSSRSGSKEDSSKTGLSTTTKVLGGAAAVAVVAGIGYAGYKLAQSKKEQASKLSVSSTSEKYEQFRSTGISPAKCPIDPANNPFSAKNCRKGPGFGRFYCAEKDPRYNKSLPAILWSFTK